MNYRPKIGTRVKSERGVIGTVVAYPKKAKHSDKVIVQKDGITGLNTRPMVKYSNLEELEES